MKPEEINMAIAELCGWKYGPIDIGDGLDVDEQSHAWWRNGKATLERPPDYYHDLNACAEFERRMSNDERVLYMTELQIATCESVRCPNETHLRENILFSLATATAPQRCEAFLRLHGKWREE